MLIYFLPLVHLVGSVPDHFLIASSLTNSTHYRMDPSNGSQQIFSLTTLRTSLVPSKTPFRPAPSRFLSRMATQPTAVKSSGS